MAAFWPTKNAHPPVKREVLARSLDGYRVMVKLVVSFRRALDENAAEATADEVARAATEVVGDEISQGRVPLSAEELGAAIQKRLSSAVNKIADIEVSAVDMVGGRQSGQQTARSRPPTSPPAVGRPPSGPPAVTSPPAARRPASDASFHQVSERASGSLLAAPPRTLWLVALSQCAPGVSSGEIANVLGLALRDSTAASLLRVLLMTDPVVVDRFALLDGRPPMAALRSEICACLAAGFSRVLTTEGWDAESASRLSERACAQALAATAPSREHLRSYMASESPVRDLARRAANTIGTPNDAAAIHTVLAPYCEALRVQFVAVARELKRLSPRAP